MEYTIKGKLQKCEHELVDYIADGHIITDGDRIPCEIGFIQFGDDIEAKYIFTQSGITENGSVYYPETYEL